MPKQAMGVYSGIRFIPEAELGVTPTTGTVRSIPFNSCTVALPFRLTLMCLVGFWH